MRKDDYRFAEAERLWEEKQFKQAMAIYHDLLKDETIPRMARAIVSEYIGRLHIGIGEIDQAEIFLTRAIEMNPDGVEHHVQLANCLCLAGRNEEAWQKIRQLYQRFPDHPAAVHYMGKMLDERGEHPHGLELMKKAIRMDPHNERFLANLSFTYMMHGNVGAAMVCSEQAMALNPDDEVVQFIHEVATEFEKQESEKSLKPQPSVRLPRAKPRRRSSKVPQL